MFRVLSVSPPGHHETGTTARLSVRPPALSGTGTTDRHGPLAAWACPRCLAGSPTRRGQPTHLPTHTDSTPWRGRRTTYGHTLLSQ